MVPFEIIQLFNTSSCKINPVSNLETAEASTLQLEWISLLLLLLGNGRYFFVQLINCIIILPWFSYSIVFLS